jgi:FAD:protein FMN transferase
VGRRGRRGPHSLTSWSRAVLLAAALSLAISGARGAEPAAAAAPELRIDGRTQGTTYRIRGFPRTALGARERHDLEDRVEARLARIDALMSSWREDSEIERFNGVGAGVSFTLSPENASLLARSHELWSMTEGAFDPTIGRSVRLWGFGGAPRRHDLPSAEEVETARLAGGFRNLVLDGRRGRKLQNGLRVDLSGIAQGYSVDEVFALLRDAGLRSLLVEIGGEVRAGEPPPGEKAWRVGIDTPAGGDALGPTLALVDVSVSTSGDYESALEVGGVRYSHILDPRTGRPATSGVASVTVVAPDCATADALATALSVLGADGALRLVEAHAELSYRLLLRNPGGSAFTERTSRGFTRWLW